QRARPDERPTRLPAATRADQCDGELAGEYLVIGEALARWPGRREVGFGGRRMDEGGRLGPTGPDPALGVRRGNPIRQGGDAIDGARYGPLHNPRRQTRGQRVDWFDRLQPVELVGSQYEVGVGDLGHAVVELDSSADHALGADREQAREVVALDVE